VIIVYIYIYITSYSSSWVVVEVAVKTAKTIKRTREFPTQYNNIVGGVGPRQDAAKGWARSSGELCVNRSGDGLVSGTARRATTEDHCNCTTASYKLTTVNTHTHTNTQARETCLHLYTLEII